MADDPKFRLTVIFNTPDAEVTLPFKTKGDAVRVIEKVVDQGFLYVDRLKDPSNYDASYYPLHCIRRFDIVEKE